MRDVNGPNVAGNGSERLGGIRRRLANFVAFAVADGQRFTPVAIDGSIWINRICAENPIRSAGIAIDRSVPLRHGPCIKPRKPRAVATASLTEPRQSA